MSERSNHDEATSPADRAVRYIEQQCDGAPLDRRMRITLNFHPDRVRAGVPILEELARDGVYRSQFETGTSNGGLTAHVGGDRWRWEQRLFGGAYDDAAVAERPKYGAINHRRRDVGGAVRFGSSHFRLAEHMLDRATFCFPDSVDEPTLFGTARCFGPGDGGLAGVADASGRDLLDDYVEAHVHGVVSLTTDVEALVLDPSFRSVPSVIDAAHRLGLPVAFHSGRVLSVAQLASRPEFRGPDVVAVGRSVARDGRLDARIVGEAVAAGRHDPQDLKRVWHHVARFGVPEQDSDAVSVVGG